jgi:hypothetical protein
MEELLDQLIKKAANETEEAHRHYIAALNGLAGECRGAPEGCLFYIYIFSKIKFPVVLRIRGPGSGALLTPCIRDTRWVKKSGSGSGMNISESLETIF